MKSCSQFSPGDGGVTWMSLRGAADAGLAGWLLPGRLQQTGGGPSPSDTNAVIAWHLLRCSQASSRSTGAGEPDQEAAGKSRELPKLLLPSLVLL